MANIAGSVRDTNGDLYAGVLVRACRRDNGAWLGESRTGTAEGPTDGDAHWDKVAAMIPCDGTNGATVFTDRSRYARTVTPVGDAHVATDMYAEGALAIDGSGDYLAISATGSELEPMDNDFTIELKFRVPGVSGTKGVIAFHSDFHLGIGLWGARIVLGVSSTGNSWSPFTPDSGGTVFAGTQDVTAAVWHDLALEVYGSTWTTYLDGGVDQSMSTDSFVFPRRDNLNIGCWGNGPGYFLSGQLRDVRYTRYARYRGAYTPQTVLPRDWPDYGLGLYEIPVDYSGLVDLRYYAPDGSNLPDLTNTVDVP